jgi:hypothetical protein
MRKLVLAFAATLAATAIGCGSKSGPVTVTPEMEAQQKEADAKVQEEETARQKTEKLTGKPTAEDEEAARARRGGN